MVKQVGCQQLIESNFSKANNDSIYSYMYIDKHKILKITTVKSFKFCGWTTMDMFIDS